jgi:hypothetical protein
VYPNGEINLSLWRVRAYLKPYKETERSDNSDDALTWSSGRYADAYLPEGYTLDDVYAALAELVWKCQQIDETVAEADARYSFYDYPLAGRPSRSRYFSKYY